MMQSKTIDLKIIPANRITIRNHLLCILSKMQETGNKKENKQ
jgi:hypothetical protein